MIYHIADKLALVILRGINRRRLTQARFADKVTNLLHIIGRLYVRHNVRIAEYLKQIPGIRLNHISYSHFFPSFLSPWTDRIPISGRSPVT